MRQNNLLKERDRGGQTGSAAGDTTRTSAYSSHVLECVLVQLKLVFTASVKSF